MVITNGNVWGLQTKCIVTTNPMYLPIILAFYDNVFTNLVGIFCWMGFIHWCIDQSYWQYGTLGLVYGPATLVIHSSYTGVWASYTGNFVVTAPVYEPASLVVHWPYTGVWANYTGSVWTSYIGHTFIIHQCMGQLYWQFCSPKSSVWPSYTGHTSPIHQCMGQPCWWYILHTPMYGPAILVIL